MRSLNAIHKSACSCGGIASHRFSIFASVGFEIACADAKRCCEQTAVAGRTILEAALARATEVRSMTKSGDENLYKRETDAIELAKLQLQT